MNENILRYSLLAGAGIFFCMSIAHFFGLKYPLLFVYYDTPYYAYQDKIIAFALISYLCLFVSAARVRAVVPAALVALTVTVLGLSAVNLSAALASVLEGRATTAYWVQTGIFGSYLLWLVVFHLRAGDYA